MHDPCTQAFEIYLGSKKKKNGQYRTPFITIWHKDPEKHGDDDSCGWFIRGRHIDPELVKKVKSEFEFNFNFKHEYWFNSGGYPKFSTIGTAINMYSATVWQVIMFNNNGNPDRKAHSRFMNKHLFDIIQFAENPTDSLHDAIHMKYGVEDVPRRVDHFTSIILADVIRKMRPWYKHPRWHINHWQIQIPIFRDFYRYWFEKCGICGARGFKGQSACSDWNGSKIWCNSCEIKHGRNVAAS